MHTVHLSLNGFQYPEMPVTFPVDDSFVVENGDKVEFVLPPYESLPERKIVGFVEQCFRKFTLTNVQVPGDFATQYVGEMQQIDTFASVVPQE